MMTSSICPRCQASALRSWRELTEPERSVILQRPSPDDPSPEHRQDYHAWCQRCGFEHCQMGEVHTV